MDDIRNQTSMLEERETVQRSTSVWKMKSGKSTSKFETDALKPSTKQKLTISNRNRRISPQRLMAATAGGKKQKGSQRLPARKTLFPTSRAQAAVDMPRRAPIKPTFLQNCLHSSVPTMENLWASSRVLRTHSWKVIQCLHSLQSPRNWFFVNCFASECTSRMETLFCAINF